MSRFDGRGYSNKVSVTTEHSSSSGTHTSSIPHFYVNINECSKQKVIMFYGTRGMVRGFTHKNNFNGSFSGCKFQVTVPRGFYIRAYSRILHAVGASCRDGFHMVAFADSWQCWEHEHTVNSPLLLTPGNVLLVSASFMGVNTIAMPFDFWLFFESTTKNLRRSFNVVRSGSAGYITLHGFDQRLNFPHNLLISHKLYLPYGHVVLLSFPYFNVEKDAETCWFSFLDLHAVHKGRYKPLWRECKIGNIPANIYNTSLSFTFYSKGIKYYPGFKALFSFHPSSQAPQRLARGLFNCSRHYDTFRHHLDCNLRVECDDREDETHQCPFSSVHCQGDIHMKDRCISYETFDETVHPYKTWSAARTICQSRGGALATIKTHEELTRLQDILRVGVKSECAYIGLQRVNFSTDSMYWKTWRWVDETTSYSENFQIPKAAINLYRGVCSAMHVNDPEKFMMTPCLSHVCGSYFCERKAEEKNHSVNNPIEIRELSTRLNSLIHNQTAYVTCPGGHVVHDFLSCDAESHCGAEGRPVQCAFRDVGTLSDGGDCEDAVCEESVELFQCHEYGGTVPYTLLCDFRKDCADNSDEKHCRHKGDAAGFRCRSGQSISQGKVCDFRKDCLDNSDEMGCDDYYKYTGFIIHRLLPPALIDMDGSGSLTVKTMRAGRPCPETHFRCPHPVYCLPVFLRCNGVKDCPYGEDELSCEAIACPGYYRCRGSSVCLHPSHVCDGWPQCPQRDDELLCNASCPSVCQCQGLAFVCHRPFPVVKYPDLRYLDGERSGIIPLEVSENQYLIYLRLAFCQIDSWPEIHVPNLQRLDLSYNKINIVNMKSFSVLQSLRFLSLKGNPLSTLAYNFSYTNQVSVLGVDLSFTLLSRFDSAPLKHFPAIESLNLSFCRLRIISEDGFVHLPKLKQLDLSGTDVEKIPRGVFAGLTNLLSIKSESYKLCCKAILPENFNVNFCFATHDEISSCEDLLRSNLHRIYLWIIGLLSILANAGFLLFRIFFQRGAKSSYSVFIISLSVGNFMMGVYTVCIAIVNEVYRGEYLWHDASWKASVMCKVAGFVSLLSNEVSAFMICLITIDRFIVLHFPFATFRFKGRSAVMASALAWLAGLLLAAVPLLSPFSHWRFYGQTGICIPLPVTRKYFHGQSFSFGVMIVFNFILFVSIAMGQAVIYWSIKTNSMEAMDSASRARDLTVARRLITVVVSDFLCWFPIGVLGLMAFSGTPVPGEVNVAMAIFVLPLNSALNPFLYTLNMLMEKRRQAREARLLTFLKARAVLHRPTVVPARPSGGHGLKH